MCHSRWASIWEHRSLSKTPCSALFAFILGHRFYSTLESCAYNRKLPKVLPPPRRCHERVGTPVSIDPISGRVCAVGPPTARPCRQGPSASAIQEHTHAHTPVRAHGRGCGATRPSSVRCHRVRTCRGPPGGGRELHSGRTDSRHNERQGAVRSPSPIRSRNGNEKEHSRAEQRARRHRASGERPHRPPDAVAPPCPEECVRA